MPYAFVQAPTTNPSRCAARCRGAAAVSRDYLSTSLPLAARQGVVVLQRCHVTTSLAHLYLSTSLPCHVSDLQILAALQRCHVTASLLLYLFILINSEITRNS